MISKRGFSLRIAAVARNRRMARRKTQDLLYQLNLGSVTYRRTLWDDDDAFPDVVRAARTVGVVGSGGIQQLYILPDPYILIDDRAADDGVFPDAYVRDAPDDVLFHLFERFEVIGAHQDRVLDPSTCVDPASQADDRVACKHAVEDAAFADHRIVYVAVVDLRGRQMSAARIDRRFGVKEIKLWQRRGKVEVSLVKSADGSDIF